MYFRNSIFIAFLFTILFAYLNIVNIDNDTQKIIYSQKNPQQTYASESEVRPLSQTLLTFPEWYLVYSPEEFSAFTVSKTSDQFPFFKEVWQYWDSYMMITRDTKQLVGDDNFGYHVMLWVIGSSTTLEYFVRGMYENSIGKTTTYLAGRSAEDDYANMQAIKYAKFINYYPWYEFDYYASLCGLWHINFFGNNFIRKIERRYILTSEYLIKLIYAKLIGLLTHSAYGVAKLYTIAEVNKRPLLDPKFPSLEILSQNNAGYLVKLPRYYEFRKYAIYLAQNNIDFIEIAGNQTFIALSVIADKDKFYCNNCQVLFKQNIYTDDRKQRIFLITPVNYLSKTLLDVINHNFVIEHVYDY